MISRTPRLSVPVSRLRTIAWLALASLVIVLLVFVAARVQKFDLLAGLPWLRIEKVEIQSEWPLTPETVRGWLPKLVGTSILLVDARDLVARLQARPWVDSVTIKKEYPNRLFLDISTRRAEAVLVVKGEAHFVDGEGKIVDKTTPALLRALDLPVLSLPQSRWVSSASAAQWDRPRMMRILDRMRRELEPVHRVSELQCEAPPIFKVFLAPHRTEAVFSLDTWEAQLPRLRSLLDSRSFPKVQPHRINLVFPKKAIVSSILSK